MCLSAGGMAANVAVGLRRLGADVALAAALGDDENGRMAEQALIGEDVDTRYLVRHIGEPTFMCVVLLTPNGEKSLVRLETGAYLPAPGDVPDAAFADRDHAHLTFGSEDLARSCINRAKAKGLSVSLDLESADVSGDPNVLRDLLPRVDWLFMNNPTRTWIERTLGPEALSAVPCQITTQGASGSQIDRGDLHAAVPGHVVQVRDSTGAGDGFVAAFLHAHLVEGRPEPEALSRANAAAALVVQAYGAQTGLPTLAQVDAFLSAAAPTEHDGARGGQHA